jgi:hypothetical protein
MNHSHLTYLPRSGSLLRVLVQHRQDELIQRWTVAFSDRWWVVLQDVMLRGIIEAILVAECIFQSACLVNSHSE